jgi:hypothetical protein
MRSPVRLSLLRRLFCWLITVAGMIALVLGVLLLPAVQQMLLRRALVSSGATDLHMGPFHATPFNLAAEQIEFRRGPLHVNASGIHLAIRPWSILRHRLELPRISADDVDISWDLDAAVHPSGSGSQPTNPVFLGLLEMLRLPIPVAVGTAGLTGRATMLHGTIPFAECRWTLHDGRLAPGEAGSLGWNVEVSCKTLIPGGVARLQATVEPTQGVSGDMSGLKLNGVLVVPGESPNGSQVSFEIAVKSSQDGESYAASASMGTDFKAVFAGGFSAKRQTAEIHADISSGPGFDDRIPPLRLLLATLHPLVGSLDATFRTDGGTWTVTRAVAAVKGGPTGAAVELDLTAPLSLAGQSTLPIEGSLRIEHLPISWANTRLASAGVHLDAGELGGAWNIELTADSVRFLPSASLTLDPLRIGGQGIPQIGALTLRADPRIEVTRTGARIVIEKLHLESERGHAIDASADVSFAANGSHAIVVNALEVSVLRRSSATPVLDLKVLRPLTPDFADLVAGFEHSPPGDLVKLTIHNMPLGWMSRCLPGRTIEGSLDEAESTVSSVAGKGLVVTTTSPWRFAGLRFTEGGREFFHGNLTVSPSIVYGPADESVRLEDLSAQDERGYRIKGRIGAGLRSSDDRVGGSISLEAEIPGFNGTGPISKPLRLNLNAQAHLFPEDKGDLSRLALTLATADGTSLFSVSAEQPVSFERTPDAEWLVSSPKPLRLSTGQIPLARLNPYLASSDFSIDGVVPATECQLQLSPRHLLIEAKTPIEISKFHLERGGIVLIDRALLRFGASFDLAIKHRLLPVFQMNGAGTFHLTDGLVAAEGSRVARFSGQVGTTATERGASLHDLSGSLWLDLGALGKLPLLARAPLPAKGELTFSLKKDQDKAKAMEFEGRLDDLIGRNGVAAPALTFSGKAREDIEKGVGSFGVQVNLLAPPHPSDLHFGMRVDYGRLSIIDLSSKLEGDYVDLDAVRQFAGAFAPAAPAATAHAVTAQPAASSGSSAAPPSMMARAEEKLAPAEGPMWGDIRGHFTLGIKKVAIAPYTIENLGGRLDVTEDSMVLSDLSGDVLDGKWSADMAVGFARGDPEGQQSFDAHVRFVQFDAGRAVRMRFPNPNAGLDGRLDLDMTLSSKGNAWRDLVSHASGHFNVVGNQGRLRLKLSDEEMISNELAVAGTVTFSSELRALGRLVGRLSDVPISKLQASGALLPNGQLHIEQMSIEAPELRLAATGQILDAKTRDVMAQPLSVNATLAATGDLAVILKGMHMLGPPEADGYGRMNQPFVVNGSVGQPDFHPLYELLAKAVDGSHGTWGLLMRKIQVEIEKHR